MNTNTTFRFRDFSGKIIDSKKSSFIDASGKLIIPAKGTSFIDGRGKVCRIGSAFIDADGNLIEPR